MSNDEIRKNIGHATSYGYAKSTGRLPEGMDEDAYAELMADYVTVGQTAVAAKNAAVAAKDAAETAAGTATTKAAEAGQSATTATNAASAAQADADAAALDASQAMSAASTATTKAAEASQSATTATNAKNDAVTAKTAAQAAQTAAETAEDNAETSATAAAASAASVQSSAEQITQNTTDINELKNTLSDLESSLISDGIIDNGVESFLIGYGNINSNGLLDQSTGESYQIYAAKVLGMSDVICSQAYVYGYFASKPSLGAFTMDGTRHFSNVRPVTVTIPQNAQYVVVRVQTGEVPTFDSTIEPIAKKVEALDECMDDVATKFYGNSASVLEHGTVTKDYYFSESGVQSGPYVDTWEYITFSVTSGETYYVSAYAGQLARLWAAVDENNKIIAISSDTSAVSLRTEVVTIPDGATKLIVNARIGEAVFNNAISVRIIDTTYKIKSTAITDNVLAGKILCCAGDSITYGADMDADGITDVSNIDVYQSNASGNFVKLSNGFLKSWGYQIAERNGMTFYNAGVSGSTVQGLSDKNGFSLADGRYTKLPDDIDYLVIWFGWNDTAYGTLGTIDDADNQSYYGGYNVVLPYLINKYPYAKIALVVPFGTDAGHRNAIRQLGNKWGVAVWDNYQGGTPLYYGKEESVGVNASIVTANRAKFQANGAHPNYRGHKQLADMIEEFLRSI